MFSWEVLVCRAFKEALTTFCFNNKACCQLADGHMPYCHET